VTAASGGPTVSRRAAPLLLFASLATAVYAVAIHLCGRLPSIDGAGALAAGVTLDLAVLVPALWYVVVVRRTGVPWPTTVPVAIASLFAASRIVPPAHHQTLGVLELAAVPLELGLLGYVGWKAAGAVRRARRGARGAADPFTALRAAAHEAVPHPRIAGIAADELSVLYGGLLSWWAKPPAGAAYFTAHRQNAWVSVVVGLLLALAAELFPVHILIARWSEVAAWIVTALSAYGGLWLLADLQAMRLRPTRLDEDGLVVRVGLRWEVPVAFEDVARIERVPPGADPPARSRIERRRTLRLMPVGEPTHRIVVRAPVTARALYGFSRAVETIELAVDEPARFDARLATFGLEVERPANGPGDRGAPRAGETPATADNRGTGPGAGPSRGPAPRG